MVRKDKEIKEQLIVLGVVLLSRLLFYFHYLINPVYQFSNGIPYYLKYDSYYYAKILESTGLTPIVIYLGTIILLSATSILIYKSIRLLKADKKWATLGTILITFMPSFFSQTLIGFVDTTFIIFLAVILYTYGNLKFINNKNGILYIICGLALSFLWTGQMALLALFVIQSTIVLFFKNGLDLNKKLYITIGLSGIVVLLALYNRISGVVAIKLRGVGEYLPNIFFLYYIILYFVLDIIYRNKHITQTELLLLIPGIAMTIGSIIIQRFASIGFIYIGLLYSMYLSKKIVNQKYYKYFIIALFIVNAFIWTYPPTANDEIADLFSGLDETDTLLTFWEYGHITNYFSKAQTESLANPLPHDEDYVYALNIDEGLGVSYLDYQAGVDNYYILIDDNNLGHYEYFESVGIYDKYPFVNSTNSIIYKTKNNIKLEYYNLVKQAKLRDRSFYLLERLGQ